MVGAGARAGTIARTARALVDRRRRAARRRPPGRARAAPAARARSAASNSAPSAPRDADPLGERRRARAATRPPCADGACAGRAQPRRAARRSVATASAPPLWKAQSMPSAAHDAADLVDGRRVTARDAVASSCTPREADRAPTPSRRCGPTRRSRRPRARARDPQARVGALQVVRRPQPGVAGADDRDVDVEWSRAAPAAARQPAELVEPEGGAADQHAAAG